MLQSSEVTIRLIATTTKICSTRRSSHVHTQSLCRNGCTPLLIRASHLPRWPSIPQFILMSYYPLKKRLKVSPLKQPVFNMEQEQEQPILSLSRERVRAALDRVKNGYQSYYGPATTNSIGCLLAEKQPNKGKEEGWVKCKVTGSRTEYYIHHLALVDAGRADDLKGLLNGKQVSHLCHNRVCFNADHLVVEDAETNRDRNKCRSWSWVTCPCGCNHKFNPCTTHDPKCILPQQ